MNIEELQNTWKQLDRRILYLESESLASARKVARRNASGTLRQLSRTYYMKAPMGYCMLLLAPVLTLVLDMPVWVAVVYAVFGVFAGTGCLMFGRHIARANFLSMPVAEAVQHIETVVRYRRMLLCVNVSLGLALVVLLLVSLADTKFAPALWGGAAGAVLGGVIGFLNIRRQGRLIKSIQRDLADGAEGGEE